jgi:MFS family permease
VNFLIADVRGALGPYLNVFLVTQQHWSQSAVGLVTMLDGVLGLVLQTPIGAAIDSTRAKRGIIVAALAAIGISAATVAAAPRFWPVLMANSLMAIAGDVLGPAVAAITLGLFRPRDLARRLGRNSAFDHAGNVVIAVVAGVVGWALGQRSVFLLVPFFAALAVAAVLSIAANAIDHQRARGAGPRQGAVQDMSGWTVLIECRPLLVFACCAMLFHFANAPLLPLVGQKLALANPQYSSRRARATLPACIKMSSCASGVGSEPIALGRFVDARPHRSAGSAISVETRIG